MEPLRLLIFREWKISTMDRVRNAMVVPSALLTNSQVPVSIQWPVAKGNHHQHRYDQSLEKHVKSHTAGKDAFSGVFWAGASYCRSLAGLHASASAGKQSVIRLIHSRCTGCRIVKR